MSDEKKESNRTTAEVSMNIVFDVYDPSTLKKNNFCRQILPKLKMIKRVLFDENSTSSGETEISEAKLGLECISEFSNSKDEESGKSGKAVGDSAVRNIEVKGKGQVMKTTTFRSNAGANNEGGKLKSFVIDFNISESIEEKAAETKESQEELGWGETDPEIEDEDLYDLINSTERFRLSVHSSASGYSKENLILDMTPQKPNKSSLNIRDSAEPQIFSDLKPPKAAGRALNISSHSRPSFLDRQNSQNQGVKKLWEDLSLNTQDMLISDQDSVMSDGERQSLAEELGDLGLEKEELVLSREILREKSGEEAKMFVETLRKMPELFKGTFVKRKNELLQKRKERQQRKGEKEEQKNKKSIF